MLDKTKDRRYRRTQKLLEKALIELLKVKNINAVSIPEIAEAADISRATFYLHYKTPHELLSKLENNLLEKVITEYKSHDILDQYDFLLAMYQCVTDNSELLALFLNPDVGSNFWEKLSSLIKKEYAVLWSSHFKYLTEREISYYGTFVIDGYFSVLKTWLRGGMQETPEQMVELSRRFQYTILPPN